MATPAAGPSVRKQATSALIQDVVKKTPRKFDIKTLPTDLQRVYGHLEKECGEEYALLFVFTMRTAIELHRAWHMTLLTSRILQSIKDKFQLRMTWDLGVVRLIFRVQDGGYELHRKVPYDYDSEFQDLYMKIAEALVAGHITVHEALIFMAETKAGKHTARSGLFLRDFPGRVIVYALEAATCTVIFFGGDWMDFGIACLTGFVAGSIEYLLGFIMKEGVSMVLDLFVGTSTGIICGLFYRYDGEQICLSGIFLGTLYWFFYGTAFVIGILEIIAGELQTGVTRFVAVSIKTFILTLGTGFGMMLTLESTSDAWLEQKKNCNTIDLGEKWWRIPMYLFCSVTVLGQYRMPIVHYWRGLLVMLVAYEVQYQTLVWTEEAHTADNMDMAASNVLGCAAAVVVACALASLVDRLRRHFFYARLLTRNKGEIGKCDKFMYSLLACSVRFLNKLGIGRKTDSIKVDLEIKLHKQRMEISDTQHPRQELELTADEEDVLMEAIVSSENLNIWAILMPAVYQLVPGSMIAKLWYNSIFPPPLLEKEQPIAGVPGATYTSFQLDAAANNVFSNLMIIATSLALGLVLGFALVQLLSVVLRCSRWFPQDDFSVNSYHHRFTEMYTSPNQDPEKTTEDTEWLQVDDNKVVESI